MLRYPAYVILLAVTVSLSMGGLAGCANSYNPFTKTDPRLRADEIAASHRFSKKWIKTSTFQFLTYQKINHQEINDPNMNNQKTNLHETNQQEKYVNIYIEGDGRSYINKYKISNDPTPHNPLALKLAVLDQNANVVYLARPCQYIEALENNPGYHASYHSGEHAGCHADIWTTHRFSENVIQPMNQAIDQIKKTAKVKKIHLIGFSGGAAIAVLIAARRQDVVSLRTVAGDLDHEQMTLYHKTAPLDKSSLNPMHFAHKISHIPQIHFVGAKDKIVPLHISSSFVEAENQNGKSVAKQIILKNATHHEQWEENWQTLLKQK